ncbi:hypothetical protein [Ferrovibrio sp.]|uniref:hypothetical protein n=1 Tax=Ferrovibrio sp. TaxID=1917215 RepID=UPI001B725EE1|nr:hypothetical protein [Ferrovibrio sp.]MBP7066360.1 hypothetical protein [Ferrovibrio sp.]
MDNTLCQEAEQSADFAQAVLGILAGLEQVGRGEGQEARAFFATIGNPAAE